MDNKILSISAVVLIAVDLFLGGMVLQKRVLTEPCEVECKCEKEAEAVYREMKNVILARDELWDCKQDLAELSNEQNHDILCTDSYCAGP